ncbi:MAG: DNA replication/repair protein RecF [Rhodospirillales bacterium]|nr:DNA replication/repair protein RecF [Rhodospirillales bacterium]
MILVRDLSLTNFRCYDDAVLRDLPAGPVVLYGANGAGKTNVLEALSLLAPGRGLRGAKVSEIQSRGRSHSWAVAADVETAYGFIKIGTGADPDKDNKRLIRINGVPAKAQSALAEYVAAVWLTPQMDRLFLDGASERRRFLDRLVFAFDPGHSGRTTRYENALRQRSKLLQDERGFDPHWVDALEATMAETGTALAAARLHFVERLQEACDRDDGTAFPHARLFVKGTVEELLARAPALEVEDMFKYQLRQSRELDAMSGGAATGPHKTDLAVRFTVKDMPAAQCSTGEQKALLIGITLAHSRLIAAERGGPPLLLLDEVAAHLDDYRRAALYDVLLAMGGQVWLTGTDEGLFRHLDGRAAFFHVENSALMPKTESVAA